MSRWGPLVLALTVLAACAAPAPAAPAAVPQAAAPVAAQSAPSDVGPTATPLAAGVAPTPEPAPSPTLPPTPVPTALPVPAAPTVPPTPMPTAVPASESICDGFARSGPLPGPGTPGAQDFFRSFREPLAPAPLYDPIGAPRRVGLQAGHWLNEGVPPELGGLQGGASGGGKAEWQVNLDVAQRAAALLEASGIEVDVLPATVPPQYRANLFLALHADGDTAGIEHGFKVARPGFSSIPSVDDRLVDVLQTAYAAATGLPRDDEHISLRMRYYYAFNSRRYCHSVAPGVPQAILEMAYLTNAGDRQYLIGDPDRLARGVADGVASFLRQLP